jgi:transcriptional regulator with XRE-family HTH domain
MNGAGGRETIGGRLRRLRLERGLSQRELAVPGVSYAYISRIEAGTRQPSVKALRKLAAKLEVSSDYLETGHDLDEGEARELRLADAELALRLTRSADAEPELRVLLDAARSAHDYAQAARAHVALGLAADERGDRATAVAELEAALALDPPSPLVRLDVYATLGRAYSALGDPAAAIRLYERCLDEVGSVAPDDAATALRYRIMLSYALSDAGDLVRAEQLLRQALKADVVASDPYMRIRVLWSLARVSEMEGRSTAALRYARHAIALLEATEDDLQAARAHVLAAWIMNSSGDPAGARDQIRRAEELFGESPSAHDVALLKVESARAAARLKEGESAVRLAREALDLIGDQYGAARGECLWALAEGLDACGDLDAADRTFAEAVEVLADQVRWREASAAARSWAALLRRIGADARALDVLDRATELALRTRQTHAPIALGSDPAGV